MGLFGLGRKDKVVDFTEEYSRARGKDTQMQETKDSGTLTSGNESAEGKKRKLAKRFSDMTTKIEELSNQVYHLQQRIELLERKLDIKRE